MFLPCFVLMIITRTVYIFSKTAIVSTQIRHLMRMKTSKDICVKTSQIFMDYSVS